MSDEEARPESLRVATLRTVAGWFGYVRLIKMERNEDGTIQLVDPRWQHAGRDTVRAMKQIRNEAP